jgi:hypothetical protein
MAKYNVQEHLVFFLFDAKSIGALPRHQAVAT